MEKFLQDWRQDALNKAQYESAIFVGDKLLAITSPSPRPSRWMRFTDGHASR